MTIHFTKLIWNRWRQKNPSLKPDLRGANLSRTKLRGANLEYADLSDADLSDADLSDADLSFADLPEAHLSRTKFTEANLTRTNFLKANLSEADLSKANLQGAFLTKALLRRANLNGAKLDRTDLAGADLDKADLRETKLFMADLNKAKIIDADLRGATIWDSSLKEADFRRANLSDADLRKSNLFGADLSGANLSGANFIRADLSEANLSKANLSKAILIDVQVNGATFTGCRVFGVSAWGVEGLEKAEQSNLVITPPDEPDITVDNLEVAQFIYLMLHSEKIRNVINTIGKKGVLILGRFTERKPILDAIRAKLRDIGYAPIVFDFERPTDRDFTETVKTLAGMSRFIIADITQPRSVPLELQATVPDYMIPMVTIIEKGEKPFSMFQDLWIKYRDWVLEPLAYESIDQLQRVFQKAVVDPANQRLLLLRTQKAEKIKMRDASDYE